MTMKSAMFQSLWQTLTRVYHGISERSSYVYTQGKIWVAKLHLWEATQQAGQQLVTSWHATSWQTLPLPLKVLLGGLVGGLIALVLLLAIWKIPQRQVAPWRAILEQQQNTSNLNPGDYLKLQHDVRKLENDARTTLVQAVGGIALFLGLLFTWRNLRMTEKNSRQTLDLSRKGQLNDRFIKAIEQLGAVDQGRRKKLEVRLGGIYALEQIAKDSPDDHHWSIMEILTAYVRENAPWKEGEQPLQEDIVPCETQPTQSNLSPPNPATDIQAILTVLGRCVRTYGKGEDQRLDLKRTALRGANLQGAHLEMADLDEAHLEAADLREAHLEGAFLWGAHLEGAVLPGAHLERAVLGGSCLMIEAFGAARLEGANLQGAHLERAVLNGARLEGANLQGAHLEGAESLMVEQLATVKTLYAAHLDPPLFEQIQRLYPQLLERPLTDTDI
jgi:hypothetical protein